MYFLKSIRAVYLLIAHNSQVDSCTTFAVTAAASVFSGYAPRNCELIFRLEDFPSLNETKVFALSQRNSSTCHGLYALRKTSVS